MNHAATLFLIRHSTSLPDPGAPAHDWGLSPGGRRRARQLAHRLLTTDPPPAHVFTSTEAKAVATGEIIASGLGVPCHSREGLHEQARRTVPWFSSQNEFQAAVAELFANPTELVFGEETAVNACDRVHRAISAIDRGQPGEPVAVVSHGTVISLFIARHNPTIDALAFWQDLAMPDCYELSRPDFHLRSRIEL